MLPEVFETVAGRARVIVDGGIYRGTDVVKALILGADVVSEPVKLSVLSAGVNRRVAVEFSDIR